MTSKVHSIADLRHVRAMLASAEDVKAVRRVDPDPGDKLNGVSAGAWEADPLGLPPGCPVKPLGVSGSRMWFLNTINQVEFLDPPYGKGHTLGLFGGRLNYLKWAWPRFSDKGTVAGYNNDEVAAALIAACKAQGPWDVSDMERWNGCWRDGAGNIVVHTGSHLVMGGRQCEPGEYEGYVYPARARIPGPWPMREELPFDPVKMLRPVLRTWAWERPDIDPHLLLGWIGGAFLGAALEWRPMVFITGGKGTGKSTLQALLKGVLGRWLLTSADTTAAGVYQHVGLSSLPVAIDELESEADSKRSVALLKLARLASSGGAMHRGGDKHQGVTFNARSAFLFSSINAPPMRPQDLSRMALLRLQRLPEGQKAPPLDGASLTMIGSGILRRLIDEWPRFEQTCGAFADELAAAGMDQRGQAQFGTLLAVADMMEHKGWNAERLSFAAEYEGDLVPWRNLLRPAGMAEFEDTGDNWMACLSHLLAVRVEAWRGGTRSTVGQVLNTLFDDRGVGLLEANNALAQAGLRVVVKKESVRPQMWLAVHNNGPLVRQLFDGSDWAGLYGAGVWSAALRQGPRGTLWEMGQCRINGVQAKATLLSLDGLYGEGGVMAEVE